PSDLYRRPPPPGRQPSPYPTPFRSREMAAARNELQQLTAAHARLRAESVQLKDQLAQTTPVSPDEVARYQATIARLENELAALRSEEHTSELQSREKLVCRLLLEKQ